MRYNKKSAMFGLDARIALAIFGALSVITGAALYSAIQRAEVISAVATLNELGKAYEQYILDTGKELETNSINAALFNVVNLIEKPAGVNGWKGPYLKYKLTADFSAEDNKGVFVDSKYKYVLISFSHDGLWGKDIDTPPCQANIGCYVYPRLNNVTPSLAKAIDEYVDGVADEQKGRVRIYHLSADAYRVLLQTGRALSQP